MCSLSVLLTLLWFVFVFFILECDVLPPERMLLFRLDNLSVP